MAAMLRHKETGELFVYTAHLAALKELELVPEDPIKKIIDEMVPKAKAADAVEAALDIPSFIPTPVKKVVVKKNMFGKTKGA